MKHLIIAAAAVLTIAVGPLSAQDIPLSQILVDKEGWRKLPIEFRNITHLGSLSDGGIAVNMNGAHGTLTAKGEFLPGPDVRIVRTARAVTTSKGNSYAIDGKDVGVSAAEKPGFRIDAVKLAGLKSPTCLALWPDEGQLVIGESDGAYLWAVRIEKDGTFGPGDRYYSLRTRPDQEMRVAAMTMDARYLLYACTSLGIQVFDPTGRLSGAIASPSKHALTAIAIGGAQADTLFVATGDTIFARRIQGKAAYTLKKKK